MRMRLVVMLGLGFCAVATTAQAQSAVNCLTPWAIPDKWIDHHDDPDDGMWTADDTFETVDGQGNPLNDADTYRTPLDPSGYTGFSYPRDHGLPITLKIGDPREGAKSGFFFAINIGIASEGATEYRSAIGACQTATVHYGDQLQPLTGNLKGPTVQGVADLINRDPDAEWDPVTSSVIKNCAPACGATSPRIVTILTFDPVEYERSWWPGGQPILQATNLVTVFVDGVVGGKVSGYLMTPPWATAKEP